MVESSAPGTPRKPLIGFEDATIDSKYRILMSKKKRERLGSDFVLTIGENNCLCAYPNDVWEELVQKCLGSSPMNSGRQMYSRELLGYAEDEIRFDDQGRFVVPSKLRAKAGLVQDVILIGCGDRVEIWGREQYAMYTADMIGYNRSRRELLGNAEAVMDGRKEAL